MVDFSSKKYICSTGHKNPGGGLAIFAGRDQWSIFLGFELRKFVFFGYWSQLLYFLGFLKKCCIFKSLIFFTVFLGPILFTRYFSNHRSPLLSYCVFTFAKCTME